MQLFGKDDAKKKKGFFKTSKWVQKKLRYTFLQLWLETTAKLGDCSVLKRLSSDARKWEQLHSHRSHTSQDRTTSGQRNAETSYMRAPSPSAPGSVPTQHCGASAQHALLPQAMDQLITGARSAAAIRRGNELLQLLQPAADAGSRVRHSASTHFAHVRRGPESPGGSARLYSGRKGERAHPRA